MFGKVVATGASVGVLGFGAYTTIDGYLDATREPAVFECGELEDCSPGEPLVITESWNDWIDNGTERVFRTIGGGAILGLGWGLAAVTANIIGDPENS